jgi:hypothetical protein
MMEMNQLIHLLSPLGEHPRARTPEQSLSRRASPGLPQGQESLLPDWQTPCRTGN